MKRYSSAPCLEDMGNETKKTKRIEHYADPSTREYLQLALARVLELQREIKEGTYMTEINNASSDLESGSEEDLTKEILAKVFHDLPGTPSSITKIIDRESRWKNSHMDAIRSKRIQLLGFDTCRKTAIEFMKTIVRESQNKPFPLETIEIDHFDLPFLRNDPLYLRNRNRLADSSKRESNAQEIRTRMLTSLDLHLAAKQRDYTAKLMRSDI